MKILVCIPCLLTGGTEIQTLSLVKALVGFGHQVVTVCYFEYDHQMVSRYESDGSRVVCLSKDGHRPKGLFSTIWFLFKDLRNVVKAEKPNVAHVQYMAPGAIPIILLKVLGVKAVVATAHTTADIYSSHGLKMLRWIQRHLLVAFTCITERAEKSFFGSSQLYTSELRLAPKGNHFTIYNNLPNYIQVAQQPKYFSNVLTIGVVSRLEHIKGMDIVVPAFSKVHESFPNTRLLVVGDGSLRDIMARQVAENKLYESVVFMGRQPQEALQDCYDKIDILLIPSRSDGFGLTAIEGMARGCVVVAADVGGLPEVVQDGVSGLLHKPEDTSDISEKITSLLHQPQCLKDVSVSAIKRSDFFSVDLFKKKVFSFYTKIEKNLS